MNNPFKTKQTQPLCVNWAALTARQYLDMVELQTMMAANSNLSDAEWLPAALHILTDYKISVERWLNGSVAELEAATKMLETGDIFKVAPPDYTKHPAPNHIFVDGVAHKLPKTQAEFNNYTTAGTLFVMRDIVAEAEQNGDALRMAMKLVGAWVQGKAVGADEFTVDAWVLAIQDRLAKDVFPAAFFLLSRLRSQQMR